MRHHPDGVSPEVLAEETGLSLQQIEAGVTWRTIDFQHWRQQFKKRTARMHRISSAVPCCRLRAAPGLSRP